MAHLIKELIVDDVKLGGTNPCVLIAGPCVIESEKSAMAHAQALKEMCARFGIGLIFKSSYDKANRTSINSYRGPGLKKGLKILAKVQKEFGVPILSDVHAENEIAAAKEVLDIIQIPAFLCRQTDFVVAVSRTKKIVNVKKGQFMAPWDMASVVKKIESTGNRKIILTERGVSFGYNNLVADLRSLGEMRKIGYPVVFDATHSVQLPGGLGSCSGGQREFVAGLARAAVAFGCDGIFIEVHKTPNKALCDGPNSISLEHLELMLGEIREIDAIVRANRETR